ncbi:MAG: phosphoadenosine phosphosulfate reductase family protein [Oscillospiraceae bacterium]|nr:phosphoadenosine phosphosulfate reductase family protein [Oscillospiraceae bacterium]
MKYAELPEFQAWPLEKKVGRAVEWIGKGFEVSRHRQAIAFSGGKDSTVLADLILRFFPDERPLCIFGNTGVEYPESLRFAREFGRSRFGDRFVEARPAKLERDGLKYKAQRETLLWLESEGRLSEVLKDDGKLKSTETLEDAATPDMWADFRARNLVWRKGTTMNYWWCVDQYGFPILGKSACKLDAHRINIDCFLKYSASVSEKPELLEYYDLLRQVKISQHCCKLLKKEPSEREQAAHDVDVVFKGLMAAESRSRMTSYCTRGELFQGRHRDHLPKTDPFWHCNPLGIWTDDDIWEYIHRFNVPYSSLYERTWTDRAGNVKKVKRNGCFGCATGIAFADNQMAVLRQIEPRIWGRLMRGGMAEQLQALRIARANGQLSIMDLYDAQSLIDIRPCVFDSVDDLILTDRVPLEYDAEDETGG